MQLSPSSRQAMVMLLFGVFVPSLDQYSDVSLVIRLMSGPHQGTVLNSCKAKDIKVTKSLTVSVLFSGWAIYHSRKLLPTPDLIKN